MKGEMKEMRGEMRQVGQCLQAGKMATPRAATNELKGSTPAGEDRVIRETCWARSVKVTVTVTQGEKLVGVTETCTSETRREVTELTETWEMGTVEKRLHGTDGVKDAHTHTEVVEDNGGELAERVETRCGQLVILLRERRETLCSPEVDHDQVGSVVPREFEGTSEANGCTRSLGGMEAPGALVVARVPGVIVPSVSVPVCVVTSVVPVCVVMSATPCVSETPCVEAPPCVSGVVTSVPECVLPSTPCVKGAPQAEGAACAAETARVCKAPCVSGTTGVSERVCVSETPRVSAPACG